MPPQSVILLLNLFISSHGDLVSASFKHVYNFNKSLWCRNLKCNYNLGQNICKK